MCHSHMFDIAWVFMVHDVDPLLDLFKCVCVHHQSSNFGNWDQSTMDTVDCDVLVTDRNSC